MSVIVSDMKPKAQIKMLKDICRKISEWPDDVLEANAEVILGYLVEGLDAISEEDGLGTEGWEHYFGYE